MDNSERFHKVLLFGSMGDIAQVAQEALLREGFAVTAVAFEQNLLRDEAGYRRELLKAVAECRPDIILPVGNTVAISRLKAEAMAGGGGPAGELPAIAADLPQRTEVLDGKISASRLAARLGIPQPRIFHSIDAVDSFPVIFKRDQSFGGSGVYRPSSKEALQRTIDHFAGKAFLIEEYIEGEDWSVDAIRFDGFFRSGCYRSLAHVGGQGPSTLRQPIACAAAESCNSGDSRSGNDSSDSTTGSVFAEDAVGAALSGKNAADDGSATAAALSRYAQMMLDAIDYHGVCGFDFRVSPTGVAYFLECNPRLTGGLSTQLSAGFNIPALLIRHQE